MKYTILIVVTLFYFALGQQVHRDSNAEVYSRTQTTNVTAVDFDKLNAELDKAGAQGEEGYQKFLEIVNAQREGLQRQYDQLADTAKDQVRGSLDRAHAWKDNARKEAEESLKRLQEFQAKAEGRNREFQRMGRLSNPAHHKLRCEEVQGERASQLGVSESDRKIICEEYSAGSALLANALLVTVATFLARQAV